MNSRYEIFADQFLTGKIQYTKSMPGFMWNKWRGEIKTAASLGGGYGGFY
jgi:hypothetical protein